VYVTLVSLGTRQDRMSPRENVPRTRGPRTAVPPDTLVLYGLAHYILGRHLVSILAQLDLGLVLQSDVIID